jgi:hypothetical protein
MDSNSLLAAMIVSYAIPIGVLELQDDAHLHLHNCGFACIVLLLSSGVLKCGVKGCWRARQSAPE